MLLREDGFSLVEFLVAAALSLLILGVVGVVLVAADRAQIFGVRQSGAVDASTVALQQIERDVRGALNVRNCDPTDGTCLLVVVRTAAGNDVTYRYTLAGEELFREVFVPDPPPAVGGTFQRDRELALQVANLEQGVPLFACPDTVQRLSVELLVRPDPNRDDVFRQSTVLRPRNGFVANCNP